MAKSNEIRALQRGFALLELANLNNNARLRDFVELSGLPKTTVFRLLDNLCRAGYLCRTDDGERYELTVRVRRLCDGYLDSGWVGDIARPVLRELSAAVGYPAAIATPYGTAMMLRENTDAESATVPDRYARGTLLPLFSSATGKVYLTYCDEMTRRTILDVCRVSTDPDHEVARHPQLVEQIIREVGKNGYAFGRGGRKDQPGANTSTCAVPIRAKRRLIGCLAIRYIDGQLSREAVIRGFLDPLKMYANRIGRRVAQSALEVSD